MLETTADSKSARNMNEVVTGNNSTVVIDDKDTVNKTVNKTVNVTKSDNTQLETDVKTIQADVAKLSTNMNRYMKRINKKLDLLMIKLEVLPDAETEKEVDDDTV